VEEEERREGRRLLGKEYDGKEKEGVGKGK